MVDEDVVYLSPSTVYRILREWSLICPWRRKAARKKAKEAAPSRPDEVWSTDLTCVQAGGESYYLITFLDDYSRYIVHYEVLLGMDADSVSMAAQKAIETLPRTEEGKPANPLRTSPMTILAQSFIVRKAFTAACDTILSRRAYPATLNA